MAHLLLNQADMKHLPKKAVIWGIDPFEERVKSNSFVTTKLPRWVKQSKATLQPVYILPSANGERGLSLIGDAEIAAEKYVQKLGVRGIRPARILVDPEPSIQDAAKRLVELALDEDVPWLVVSSQGRSGLDRLVLGSFAESLLRISPKPVLFLGNSRKQSKSAGKTKVLFPTDFSDASMVAFEKFVRQARDLDFKLVVYHVVSLPSMPAGAEASMINLEDYFGEQTRWAEAEGSRWVHRARLEGVAAETVVADGGLGPRVGELILESAAKQKVEMIAMASVSGRFSALLAGSIAQDVFRSRRFPVWVYGPKAVQKPAERSLKNVPSLGRNVS